ncbi:hypothetical protein LBMAG34_1360 [Candidatus Saccharibacteria bacterium]|nr:hypothetical protein LBMAG34_1360 [Candidatus Saccharibacteria bacterium]
MSASIPLKVNDLSTPKVSAQKKRRGRPKKDSTIRKMDISPRKHVSFDSVVKEQDESIEKSLVDKPEVEVNSSERYHSLPVHADNLGIIKQTEPEAQKKRELQADDKIVINLRNTDNAKLVLTI